jgi:hypothetical protein
MTTPSLMGFDLGELLAVGVVIFEGVMHSQIEVKLSVVVFECNGKVHYPYRWEQANRD